MTDQEIIEMAYTHRVASRVTHDLTPVLMQYHADHLQSIIELVRAVEAKQKAEQ